MVDNVGKFLKDCILANGSLLSAVEDVHSFILYKILDPKRV